MDYAVTILGLYLHSKTPSAKSCRSDKSRSAAEERVEYNVTASRRVANSPLCQFQRFLRWVPVKVRSISPDAPKRAFILGAVPIVPCPAFPAVKAEFSLLVVVAEAESEALFCPSYDRSNLELVPG